MPAVPDVVIIGGGVIGCSIAYYLAKAGVKVTLLERDQMGSHASSAAAGMLAPLAEAGSPGPLVELGMASLRLFEPLAQALREETGIDIEYMASGSLRLALTEEEERALKQRGAWQHAQGFAAEWLNGEEARKREPALAPALRGALASTVEAHVQSPRLVRALAQGATRYGAQLCEGSYAVGLLHRGSRMVGVRLPDGVLESQQVILAAGCWSGAFGQELGVSLPVHPVRGQILSLDAPPNAFRSILFSGHRYLCPKADGSILVGSTMEQVGYDRRVTVEALAALSVLAQELVPALAQATFRGAWAGLRPGTPDGLPLLGPLPGWEGILVASGHFRNGILLSPITGQLMAELVTMEKTSLSLEPFSLARFTKGQPPPSREGVQAMKEGAPTYPKIALRPLTDEEAKQALEAMKRADALIEAIRKRRKGKPLPSSWRSIRKDREERSKQI